jgi:hypothetical protein
MNKHIRIERGDLGANESWSEDPPEEQGELFNKTPSFKLPENPKNAAERVLCFCVSLFQTTNTPVVLQNDPYDQTVNPASKTLKNRARISCKIVSGFTPINLAPRGDGACEAFERDLNMLETENDDDYDADYLERW